MKGLFLTLMALMVAADSVQPHHSSGFQHANQAQVNQHAPLKEINRIGRPRRYRNMMQGFAPGPGHVDLMTMESRTAHVQQIYDDDSLPAEFDGRTAFPGCIGAVLDQGQCGSCWAFASTECLSDRLCIYKNEKVTLSPQNALDCEKLNLGCTMGSMPEWAWSFLEKTGVTTMECVPYVSGNTAHARKCESGCAAGSTATYKKYYAKNASHVGNFVDPARHVQEIMRAVTRGPLDATFIVYSDFMKYEAGTVYEHKHGLPVGVHSVKIIGYGSLQGQDYWLVQNSWGKWWGDNGYFMIRRGKDTSMFETLVFEGFPQ